MRHVNDLADPRDAVLAWALARLGVRTLRPLSVGDLDLFSWPGPKPGETAFDFDATTPDGSPLRLSELLGRPLVIETGSLSCPFYRKNVAQMGELARRFPELTFLVLYVSEAHPTAEAPRPTSETQKLALVRRAIDTLHEERRVLSADLSGAIHAAYGGYQNMVYILDAAGAVVFRSNQCYPKRVVTILEQPTLLTEAKEDFVLRPSETGILRTFGWSQLTFIKVRERLRFEAFRINRAVKGRGRSSRS